MARRCENDSLHPVAPARVVSLRIGAKFMAGILIIRPVYNFTGSAFSEKNKKKFDNQKNLTLYLPTEN
jgi:cbb3-type cytochrome oxidase subunit 3